MGLMSLVVLYPLRGLDKFKCLSNCSRFKTQDSMTVGNPCVYLTFSSEGYAVGNCELLLISAVTF